MHNQRLASLVMKGVGKEGMMITVTLAEGAMLAEARADKLNSVLTSIAARLRRAGLLIRVIAREYGKLNGRLHEHIWVNGQLEKLYEWAMEHWRGFKEYAESWLPDEGAKKAQWLQQLWVSGNWKGRGRPYAARSDHELIMGRYLARVAVIGYIDMKEEAQSSAVGYLLKYVGKGGAKGRISYSRAAMEGWQRATIGVYIHEGYVHWYMDVDSERSRWWRAAAIRRLDEWSVRRLPEPSTVGWGQWLKLAGCANGEWSY